MTITCQGRTWDVSRPSHLKTYLLVNLEELTFYSLEVPPSHPCEIKVV